MIRGKIKIPHLCIGTSPPLTKIIAAMDEWLTQTEGIIDHGNRAAFPGTQPVCVVTHITIGFFQNTHQDFFDEIVELVKEGKINNELDVEYGEEGLSMFNGRYRTPKIFNESRTIYLHETFLSYQVEHKHITVLRTDPFISAV